MNLVWKVPNVLWLRCYMLISKTITGLLYNYAAELWNYKIDSLLTLLTRWLPTTSILVVIGRIYRI